MRFFSSHILCSSEFFEPCEYITYIKPLKKKESVAPGYESFTKGNEHTKKQVGEWEIISEKGAAENMRGIRRMDGEEGKLQLIQSATLLIGWPPLLWINSYKKSQYMGYSSLEEIVNVSEEGNSSWPQPLSQTRRAWRKVPCSHLPSPGQVLWGYACSTDHGSSPCSNREMTSGLAIWFPTHGGKNTDLCSLENVLACSSLTYHLGRISILYVL